MGVSSAKPEIGVSASITDKIVYENGKFDVKTVATESLGISIIDNVELGRFRGKEHSFKDPKCTCNVWEDPYGARITCPASREIKEDGSSVGVGIEGYLGIGAEIYIGIDLDAWGEELMDIFNDSLNYR